MKKLESLEITFENCEFATFSTIDIGFVRMTDITKNMFVASGGEVIKGRNAGSVVLEILPTGNRLCETQWDPKKPKFIFQRIMEFPDITHIDLTYTNGKVESYSVNWEDADDAGEENKFQKTELREDGTLIVVISDIFDTEEPKDA